MLKKRKGITFALLFRRFLLHANPAHAPLPSPTYVYDHLNAGVASCTAAHHLFSPFLLRPMIADAAPPTPRRTRLITFIFRVSFDHTAADGAIQIGLHVQRHLNHPGTSPSANGCKLTHPSGTT